MTGVLHVFRFGPNLAAAIVACAFFCGLQGCASTSTTATREQQIEAQQATQEAADDAKCKQGGVQPSSPAYEQCRQQLAEKRMQEEAAQEKRREAFQKTLGEGTSAAGGI
mgnify:CR=1 FL=1